MCKLQTEHILTLTLNMKLTLRGYMQLLQNPFMYNQLTDQTQKTAFNFVLQFKQTKLGCEHNTPLGKDEHHSRS